MFGPILELRGGREDLCDFAQDEGRSPLPTRQVVPPDARGAGENFVFRFSGIILAFEDFDGPVRLMIRTVFGGSVAGLVHKTEFC